MEETTNHVDIIESNSDYLLTETSLRTDTPHSEIMQIIKKSNTTGSLCYQLSDGGIRRIELKQKTKARGDAKRDKLREMFGHT